MNKHLSYIIPLVFCILLLFGAQWVYTTHRMLFDITFPIAAIILVALHVNIVKFITELNQKNLIKKQFGSYVNPVIVERLQKNPEFIKLGGETKELTVVMTDMRNFTGLGESFGDRVEEFTTVMNRYMTHIAGPILANNGCLIKFIGDASLHVHGAPIQEEQDPDHAVAAVRTGLEMLETVKQFNIELAAEGRPPVGMGIGINTGPVLIGNIGAKTRFGYDVLGDTVSVTARLEGQSKNYGVLLVLGPETAARLDNEFFVLELDSIAVKGKTVGVDIYTAFHNPDAGGAVDWLMAKDTHDQMLVHYRNQQWDQARELTSELRGEFDGNMDQYYDMWLNRIEEMRMSNLPAEWDCIYRADSK